MREELWQRQVPWHPPSARGTRRRRPSLSLLASLLTGWTGMPMASVPRSSTWTGQQGELMVKDRRETTRHHFDVGGGFGGGGEWGDGNQEQKGWSGGNYHFWQHVRWGDDDGHTQQWMQPIVIVWLAMAAAAAATGVKLSCRRCTPTKRPRRRYCGRTVDKRVILPLEMPAVLEFGMQVGGENKKQNVTCSAVRFCQDYSGPIRNYHWSRHWISCYVKKEIDAHKRSASIL